ncbi:MAG: DUF2087 domain-containing protein [Clostridiaceae bacterium]|jgi:hypothetical protein|nr:DUF2087 domain-containing protein [Clostridiaceae bacterium]
MGEIPDEIKKFFNKNNQLKQWPSKKKDKLLVLEFLSKLFENNKTYS